MNKIFPAVILAVLVSLNQSHAQLAITEAMSSSMTNSAGLQHSDFWELTNFGTNSMDLTDYKFYDSSGDVTAAQIINSDVFDGLIIGPGESVILLEIQQSTNASEFIDWWGAANLPPNIQVRTYDEPGLGSTANGDGLQLWDANDNPVDSVSFGEATRGTTFTYNTNSGSFGVLSELGAGGAFSATVNADIGSPGYTAGPVPLTILQQPTNLTVNAGSSATFMVSAQGLPKPRYQWYFKSNVIDGATAVSLIITNAQTNDAGSYSVVVSNGVESLLSSNAVLTVDPALTAPTFTLRPPTNINPTIGQTVTLTSQTTGFPTPSYQWQSNSVDLVGQTANQLVLPNVQTNDSATYTVVAYNTVGTNSASALVTVTPKPKLFITEAQSSEALPNPNAGHTDWWELSNLDDHSVNLRGYRFDDSSASIGNSFTFTDDIVIKPGESIVFVQDIPAANFRSWWGTNLAPSVQVTTYPDNGLGLSSGGDGLFLWNPTATDNADTIAGISFSAAPSPAGRTFVYDPDAPIAGILNVLATAGVNGAFAATNSLDIGSPGRIIEPLFMNAKHGADSVDLTWPSTPNRGYTIEYKDSVSGLNWTTLTSLTAVDSTTTNSVFTTMPERIYRVRVTIVTP